MAVAPGDAGDAPGDAGEDVWGRVFKRRSRRLCRFRPQTLRLFQSGHLRSASGTEELGPSFVQFRSLLAQKLRDKRRLDRVSDRVHFSPHRTDLQIELEAGDPPGDPPGARPRLDGLHRRAQNSLNHAGPSPMRGWPGTWEASARFYCLTIWIRI